MPEMEEQLVDEILNFAKVSHPYDNLRKSRHLKAIALRWSGGTPASGHLSRVRADPFTNKCSAPLMYIFGDNLSVRDV